MADPLVITMFMNSFAQAFGNFAIVGVMMLILVIIFMLLTNMDRAAWGFFAIMITSYMFLFNLLPPVIMLLALIMGGAMVFLIGRWVIEGGFV